jgi:ABC-2 type transport system ATP-binding protein
VSIVCQNLTKVFETQVAVNNINLNIGAGEVVGFLGPNGAGKSTTMKMITGYHAPTSGQIHVCGQLVNDENLEVKKKIGYLPESNPLYHDMYVVEYLEFVASIHKIANPAARIKEVIHQTGLHVEQHKRIGALSKGYKQRVGLCQALVHDPQVLILDEPTSGLDPNQILDIRQLIIELGKSKTVLLSSHIMQEVEAMCQRVVLINKGNIVADSSIADLKTGAAEKSQQVVLVCKQAITKEKFANTQGVTSVDVINGNTLRFTCNDADACKKQIMQTCLNLDLDIEQLQTEGRSLEHLFRTLTASSEA